MWITVAILAVVISVIQFAGDYAARSLHRRGRGSAPPKLRFLRNAPARPGGRRRDRNSPRRPDPPPIPRISVCGVAPPAPSWRKALFVRNTAKITAAVLAAGALTLGLTACGSEKSGSVRRRRTVRWSSPRAPTPHAEILNYVKDNLAKKAGLDLQVKEFTDYVLPNTATQQGEVGANYFQHKPYLDDFNKKNGTDIVPVGDVAPGAARPLLAEGQEGRELKDGATVAVPNDTTNEGRALKLLDANGVIKLKDGVGQRGDPQGHRREPQEPRVQGAGGGHRAPRPRRRRRRGDQRQLRRRGQAQPRQGRPDPGSRPRATRTPTSWPSRRATRTTRASRSSPSSCTRPRSRSTSTTSTTAPSSRRSDNGRGQGRGAPCASQ